MDSFVKGMRILWFEQNKSLGATSKKKKKKITRKILMGEGFLTI
jgi:hypothetical protein